MLTWYDARDEACCPLRQPRTGYKARQGSGLCTSMGREQTAGQHGRSAGDLAAGWLYTDWIQEPDEVQHTRLWRGCSLNWSEGVSSAYSLDEVVNRHAVGVIETVTHCRGV